MPIKAVIACVIAALGVILIPVTLLAIAVCKPPTPEKQAEADRKCLPDINCVANRIPWGELAEQNRTRSINAHADRKPEINDHNWTNARHDSIFDRLYLHQEFTSVAWRSSRIKPETGSASSTPAGTTSSTRKSSNSGSNPTARTSPTTPETRQHPRPALDWATSWDSSFSAFADSRRRRPPPTNGAAGFCQDPVRTSPRPEQRAETTDGPDKTSTVAMVSQRTPWSRPS